MNNVTHGCVRPATAAWMVWAAACGTPAAASPGVDVIPVAGSNAVVTVWDEVAADGNVAHFYSISLDDGARARVVQTSYQLLLKYGAFDPLAAHPVVPDRLAIADDAELARIEIVQFVTQPLEAYREAIRELGGTVYNYVPNHSHLVKMTPAVREQVEALPFVRWVGAYHPAFRLESFLVEHADEAAQAYPLQRYNIMVFEAGMKQKSAVAAEIRALGGVVDRAHAGKYTLEATLTPEQLFHIAGLNEVLYIDRWTPWSTDMNLAREIGGANFVETAGGYTGTGVRGEVIDIGFNTGHVDFQSSPLILHTPVNSESHGASTSGIIFGDGTGNSIGRGLIPDAQGIIADVDEVFTGPARYDHTGELVQSPYFAVFQSSSVGSLQVLDYTSISAETDAMLFDFDILHCQSQSNTGSQNSRPQAWAKNIVSVGGIRHFDTLTTADDCWGCGATAASIGPAADGRLKPDLCAFYDNIFTTTTGSNVAYTSSFGGTSGATPIVAGHFGIFFEMWSDGIFGYPVVPGNTVFENRPHMATAKAMLINAADQYDFSGTGHDLTRTHQGWGRPSVKNLYDLREKMFIIDETDILQNLDIAVYQVFVDTGEPAVRFTMVYTDPPGLPGTTRHRVNDLTLKVTSPGGTVYWGNNGLDAGNWSTPDGVANTVDTVENVFVQNPATGTWTIEVRADEINQDSHVETPGLDADFALVVTGVEQTALAMLITLPENTPVLVPPGTPTDIPVNIIDGSELVQPATAALHYRFDPGNSFVTVPMMHQGGIDYLATLPGAPCNSTPQFYFSAEGDGGTTVTNPGNAPIGFYETTVGVVAKLSSDDFETDQGWTVQDGPGLSAGSWERGVPIGGGDRGDPATDFDGSGQCWLTQNVDGNSDVDGGLTWLISPAFDLTDVDASIEYALWYTNNAGSNPGADVFNVYVSNDDGANWVLARTHGPISVSGWSVESFLVSDHVSPTSTVRVRFEASDLGGGSVVEAGIDALAIIEQQCEDPCSADLDGDGQVGITDFLDLLAQWGTDPGGPPDLDGDGDVGIVDFLDLLSQWGPCP